MREIQPLLGFARNFKDMTLHLLDSSQINYNTFPIRERLTTLPGVPHKAKR